MTKTVNLWPTKILLCEHYDSEHNAEIEKVLLDRPIPSNFMEELRIFNVEKIENDSIQWMLDRVRDNVSDYMLGLQDFDITARAVILRKGCHLRTHTERDESDLAVAYWPSGDMDNRKPINNLGDGIQSPTFVIEDPSRGLNDARLPFENYYSFPVTPRAGLMVVFPSHVPHSMYPWMGEKPFVHIVFQIRFKR